MGSEDFVVVSSCIILFLKNKLRILHEHFGKCEFLARRFCMRFGACFLVKGKPKCAFVSSSVAMSVLHVVNGSSFLLCPKPFCLALFFYFLWVLAVRVKREKL